MHPSDSLSCPLSLSLSLSTHVESTSLRHLRDSPSEWQESAFSQRTRHLLAASGERRDSRENTRALYIQIQNKHYPRSLTITVTGYLERPGNTNPTNITKNARIHARAKSRRRHRTIALRNRGKRGHPAGSRGFGKVPGGTFHLARN